ncbi:hypothetical protein M513_04022 [Trichuris suis]|uniref:Uncharacterized protein n=1 Tax=Trichuris suis TaxID=68888 RepID=A0A085MD08_9BILA|nr:hypothetical protein M513_04022 [Trichuris suis]
MLRIVVGINAQCRICLTANNVNSKQRSPMETVTSTVVFNYDKEWSAEKGERSRQRFALGNDVAAKGPMLPNLDDSMRVQLLRESIN